jgi:ankyrin repeat protein
MSEIQTFIPFILLVIIILLLFLPKIIRNRRLNRLIYCVIRNDLAGVKKMLEPSLCNLYFRMKSKKWKAEVETALRYAAMHGHNDIVRFLIQHSATPIDELNQCLYEAYRGKHYDTLELFFNEGIDPDSPYNIFKRLTLLQLCIEEGNDKFAKTLLAKGAKVNTTDTHKNTPLLWAVRHSNLEMAEELLKMGANPDAVNEAGDQPLELALKNGELVLSLMLMENGCHVRDSHGKLMNSTLPKDTWVYVNQKWDLSLKLPIGWQVVWENEPEGGWEIVVGVKGISSFSGQTMLTVRMLPHAVLNFQPENVKVYASGGGGIPTELARTPEEYAEGCKKELRMSLPIIQFSDEEIGTLAGMPSSTLTYYMKSRTGIIREKQINIFGQQTTYRLICEMPLEQSEEVEKYFDSLVADFQPSPTSLKNGSKSGK